MIIKVTKGDINNGLPADMQNCPIAQAIYRYTKSKDIHVWPQYAIVDGKKFYLPVKAKEFIVCYDMGYVLSPFQFSLKYEVKIQKAKRPVKKVVKASVVETKQPVLNTNGTAPYDWSKAPQVFNTDSNMEFVSRR